MNRQEMKEFMMDEMIKFHAILTPEQRNKAADKMKNFHERRNKHEGREKKDNK
jgi:Spy/CpxP family protein refolding chaperone